MTPKEAVGILMTVVGICLIVGIYIVAALYPLSEPVYKVNIVAQDVKTKEVIMTIKSDSYIGVVGTNSYLVIIGMFLLLLGPLVAFGEKPVVVKKVEGGGK